LCICGQLLRPPNTDGWGNKLVTIFARHLDNFILTNNFSLIYQIRDFGSGQILQPRQFYLSLGLAKIAPWWLVRRDYFSAKVPRLVSADSATNVYSLNRRAVIANAIVISDIDYIEKTCNIPRPLNWHICFCATQEPTLMQKQKSQMLSLTFLL
jgi:hypothetical protein